MNNYGHLPYEKQQELLWELGEMVRRYAEVGLCLQEKPRFTPHLSTYFRG